MNDDDVPNLAALVAGTSGPLLRRRPLGVLRLRGATRLDLVDRMSTQKVKDLPLGAGAATVFTTEIGRIIDRVLLYAGEEEVIALTGEGFNDPLARYLLSYVFFGDDFHLEDVTAGTAVLALYGAAAADALRRAGLDAPAELPRHHWLKGALAGISVTLHRTDPLGGDGWLLLVPAENADAAEAALAAAGAEVIDDATYDWFRVAAGLPRFGRELTQDYIPLEAGLWDDVSFNKGCYTGQEIIARLESRGRLAKRLVRLRLARPLPAGTPLEAGGRAAGTITSSAGLLALGYVMSSVLADGTPLAANGVTVEVVAEAEKD